MRTGTAERREHTIRRCRCVMQMWHVRSHFCAPSPKPDVCGQITRMVPEAAGLEPPTCSTGSAPVRPRGGSRSQSRPCLYLLSSLSQSWAVPTWLALCCNAAALSLSRRRGRSAAAPPLLPASARPPPSPPLAVPPPSRPSPLRGSGSYRCYSCMRRFAGERPASSAARRFATACCRPVVRRGAGGASSPLELA